MDKNSHPSSFYNVFGLKGKHNSASSCPESGLMQLYTIYVEEEKNKPEDATFYCPS